MIKYVCFFLSLSHVQLPLSSPCKALNKPDEGEWDFWPRNGPQVLVEVSKPHALFYAAHGGTSRGYSGNLKAEQCLPSRSVGHATP